MNQSERAASDDQLTLLLARQTTDFGILTLDVEGRVRTWNDGAERILQYRPAEIIGQHGAVLFTDADRAKGRPEVELQRARETGRAEDTRWHRRRDGSEVWVTGAMTALRDDDERLIGYGKIVRDVTAEREAAERAKDAEHALLTSVFELSPAILAVLRGPEHVFELANPAYYQLVGHREILGLPVRDALPEVEGQGFFELLDDVYRTGQPFIGSELPVRVQRTPRGGVEERNLNFVYQAIRSAEGEVSGILVTGVDVTDLVRTRQQVERALAKSERLAGERDAERRQLITVLQQSPLAIAIVDAPSGRMVFANHEFAKIFGRVVMSDDVDEYSEHYRGFHPDGRRVTSDEWPAARAVRGEEVRGALLEVEHTEGRRITVSINAAPIRDGEGRVTGAVVMFRDVTVERRLERQLQDAQRLQAVGTLAGGVAHEINNQMTAVLGFGAFVLSALGPDHPQAPDQRVVLQAAQRAARVSQQLLAYTRQQVTQPRPVDLHALVRELEPVLQQLLGADKRLQMEAPPNPDATASLVDAAQVQQVLINLVANARDASESGATVTISVAPVELAAELRLSHGEVVPPGRYVRLSVADHGQGMDADTVTRIFDPFFTTKPVGMGTGLGLSMVHGTVKRHGGYIGAVSRPGAGTTMELYWPAAPGGAPAAEGGTAADGAASGAMSHARILVVEDEPVVRALAVRTLEREGYAVTSAEDGAAALEETKSQGIRPDLLVTDVLMPRLNGRQVADALTARWPGLPVLYVSGHTGEGDVLRRLLPDGAPFLQKPFSPDELARAVADLLRKHAS